MNTRSSAATIGAPQRRRRGTSIITPPKTSAMPTPSVPGMVSDEGICIWPSRAAQPNGSVSFHAPDTMKSRPITNAAAVLAIDFQRAVSKGDAGTEASKDRSEEHTSELQSPCNLVCRLLLEKKKIMNLTNINVEYRI